MELRHLRYFTAVVEEGSLLRAAQRLHISQPPLSTQIKDLEDELGARLLLRSARGVRATPAGEALYAEAQSILARVAQAKAAVQRAATGEQGRLALGFVSIVDYSFLPPALKLLRTRFPGIDVVLHELTTDAQLKELAAERLDVGIALGPVSDDGVAFTPLSREPLVLAVAADHRLAGSGRGSVRPKQLVSEDFVMIPRAAGPGYHDTFTAYCRGLGFVPRIAQQATQMQTVISLVAGGFGVALVPASLRNLQRTGVSYLTLQGDKPSIELGLVSRMGQTNPAVAQLLAVVREVLGKR